MPRLRVYRLRQEAGALIDPDGLSLYLIGSIPEISEVYLVYRGELAEPHYGLSEEATEVELYTQTDAPWEEFAYPDVAEFSRRGLFAALASSSPTTIPRFWWRASPPGRTKFSG